LVRNQDRAKAQYEKLIKGNIVELITGALEDLPYDEMGDIDYIIHCAGITDSQTMNDRPVDIIDNLVCGTKAVLDLAICKGAKRFIYISSIEVYGETESGECLEDNLGQIDLTNPRNSYPESKRMAEMMCYSYNKQYGLSVAVARLASTLTPFVSETDKRLTSYLINCMISGQDIVLNTSGEKCRSFVYIIDADTAILTILTSGAIATFNVANKDAFTSIIGLANITAKMSDKPMCVRINQSQREQDVSKYNSCAVLNMNSSRLESLGWSAHYGLEQMLKGIGDYYKAATKNDLQS
jgi:nucleoside-diphosphate-sugar epimerase